jgi:ABC-type sugar transport system ATPase subunit
VLLNLYATGPPRRGPVLHRAAMMARAAPVLAELGLNVSFRQPVGSLSLADQQRIEIARALLTGLRILVLDEPTSALEPAGTRHLLDVVGVLRDRGVGVVFVSHILEEALSLSDEVTILRDGAVVTAAAPRATLTIPAVVTAMLGDRRLYEQAEGSAPARDGPAAPGAPSTADEPAALLIDRVSLRRQLSEVSMTARPGEIVGLAGLAGAGQHALLDVSGRALLRRGGRASIPVRPDPGLLPRPDHRAGHRPAHRPGGHQHRGTA